MIRLLNVYYPTRTVLLLLCEALIVSSCFLGATVLALGWQDSVLALNYELGWFRIGAVTTLSLVLSYYFDLYEPQIVSAPKEIYLRVLLVLGFGCFIVSAVIYAFPDAQVGSGRTNIPIFALGYALLTPALLVWRRVYEWIVSRSIFRERVIVLGSGPYARSIVDTIRTRSEIGMEVVDWEELDCSPSERKSVWVAKLNALASNPRQVSRIIVAMEAQRGELPVEELLALRLRGFKVEEAGSLRERLSGKIQLDGLRPSSFLYAEGFRIKNSQQLTRRLLSIVAASAGLLIFAPFFPAVFLLVRLSSKGPVFFSQTRVGMNSKPFSVYKFRSMAVDAEADGARWASKNDPRVTKFGMFMRKTRIDEIPQLWNVLRGDMSFVGPRPERPEFVPMLAEAIPFFQLRHVIRPGLTGWAQIRYGYGSSMAETREKLEFDLYYVKHMSLGLDLLIMFETIKTIIHRRGSQ